jgi:hypothetical protein
MKPMSRNRVALALLIGSALLSACSTVRSHWPFGKRAVAAPTAVQELLVEAPAEGAPAAVLQFWERNTLVVDLQGVAAAGSVRLVKRPELIWPVRIAFRMAPGRFGALEVRGAQRIVLPVAAEAGAPVTAMLPPGAVAADTKALTVSWGASGAF